MSKIFKTIILVVCSLMLALPSNAFWGSNKKESNKKDAANISIEEESSKDSTSKTDKEIADKLLKLDTLEQSFGKALKKRSLLGRFVIQKQKAFKAEKDEAKKEELKKNLQAGLKQLNALKIAMDVVFGIGNRREYEYNRVTSTIYLKVGTVDETFARAMKARNILAKNIIAAKKALDDETDDAKKDAIKKQINNSTRQYQLVVASLQIIFQVTPQRQYEFNPKNSTLYLKVTDSEVTKLKAQIAKMNEERKAKKDK